jgi:hypothetical protein
VLHDEFQLITNGGDRSLGAKHLVNGSQVLFVYFKGSVEAIFDIRSECDNDCRKLRWIESSARNVQTLWVRRLSRRGNKTCLRPSSSVNGLELEAKVGAKKRSETPAASDQS